MFSNQFSGFLMMDNQGNIVSSNNQQSTERKMPVTAKDVFHLSKSKEGEYQEKWIESIESDIRSSAHQGLFCTSQCFGRGSSFYIKALKEHFTNQGFDVTEEKDEDGDPRLVFSWQNHKDAEATA